MKVICASCKKAVDKNKAIEQGAGLFGSSYFCAKKCMKKAAEKTRTAVAIFVVIMVIWAVALLIMIAS